MNKKVTFKCDDFDPLEVLFICKMCGQNMLKCQGHNLIIETVSFNVRVLYKFSKNGLAFLSWKCSNIGTISCTGSCKSQVRQRWPVSDDDNKKISFLWIVCISQLDQSTFCYIVCYLYLAKPYPTIWKKPLLALGLHWSYVGPHKLYILPGSCGQNISLKRYQNFGKIQKER
jgi:hypothetical protein